jgi:hypothetical protein
MTFSKHILSSFSLIFMVFIVFNTSYAEVFNYNNFFHNTNEKNIDSQSFPYKVNFTESETKKFDSLPLEIRKKILDYATQLYTNSVKQAQLTESSASPTNKDSLKNQPQANSLAKLLSPFSKPNTAQSSQVPPPAHSGASGLNDTDPRSNPNYNPQYAPQDPPFSRQPLGNNDMVDFSKLPPAPPGSCPNYGVRGNMNGIKAKIRLDTNCLCIALGGQLNVVSGYRKGDPRNHGQGLAIDIAENNFRNPQKDAMLVVALIALGYNIGSYHPGFGSFHADKENSNKWKTWSGVAHTNYQGGYARNYYQMIQDALNLIGTPAISAAQFRNTYGNPPITAMAQKARSYIQKNGNEALNKCISI